MSWKLWSAFVVLETVLCLTPGPAVLFVVARAMSQGFTPAVWGILGILTANIAYFLLSATGVGSIIVASHGLFLVLKGCGAAYLVWLGLTELLGKRALTPALPVIDRSRTSLRSMRDGFVLQASDPKALIFFIALLPQFIDPHGGIFRQVGILAATSVAIEFSVQISYAALAGSSCMAIKPKFAAAAARIAGSFLIVAGIGLALQR